MKSENVQILHELEQISSCFSHELNDPLEEALRVMADEEVPSQARALVEQVVRRQAFLRDYTYLMQNKERLQPVSLDELWQETRQALHAEIEQAQASIEVAPLPEIVGKPRQLQRCFEALLRNSLHYRGDRPASIQVTATQEAAQWHLVICDQGIGMEPNLIPLACGLFRRLHNDDNHEALGCGLSVCVRVMHNHGGELKIDSAPEQGCRVTLSFPAKAD